MNSSFCSSSDWAAFISLDSFNSAHIKRFFVPQPGGFVVMQLFCGRDKWYVVRGEWDEHSHGCDNAGKGQSVHKAAINRPSKAELSCSYASRYPQVFRFEIPLSYSAHIKRFLVPQPGGLVVMQHFY